MLDCNTPTIAFVETLMKCMVQLTRPRAVPRAMMEQTGNVEGLGGILSTEQVLHFSAFQKGMLIIY